MLVVELLLLFTASRNEEACPWHLFLKNVSRASRILVLKGGK